MGGNCLFLFQKKIEHLFRNNDQVQMAKLKLYCKNSVNEGIFQAKFNFKHWMNHKERDHFVDLIILFSLN